MPTKKYIDIFLADLATVVKTLPLSDPRHLKIAGQCLGFSNLHTTQRPKRSGGYNQKLKHRHSESQTNQGKQSGGGYVIPPSPMPDPERPKTLIETKCKSEQIPTNNTIPVEKVQFKKQLALSRNSLFQNNTANGILSAAINTSKPGRHLNIEQLIQIIAQAKPLRPIPYLPAATLSQGVQLLLDQGESMTPFYPDLQNLIDDLVNVVSKPQLEVFDYRHNPIEASRWTVSEKEIAWKPQQGRPILFATDFGLGLSHERQEQFSAKQWRQLFRNLLKKGCPVVCLIPFPPGSWPQWIDQAYTPIHWDPRTRSETVRKLVGLGHKVNT